MPKSDETGLRVSLVCVAEIQQLRRKNIPLISILFLLRWSTVMRKMHLQMKQMWKIFLSQEHITGKLPYLRKLRSFGYMILIPCLSLSLLFPQKFLLPCTGRPTFWLWFRINIRRHSLFKGKHFRTFPSSFNLFFRPFSPLIPFHLPLSPSWFRTPNFQELNGSIWHRPKLVSW